MEQLNTADTLRSRNSRCGEVCVVLLSLLVIPVFLYGPGILLLPVAGMFTALLLDMAVQLLFKRRKRYRPDLHSVAVALVATLLLSPSTPVWVAAVTVLFGLGTAKYLLGNMFHPAAVGLTFSLLCWPKAILSYPIPQNPLANTQGFLEPLSKALRMGYLPKADYIDLLLGQFAGPMGATAMLILVACFLYLSFRRLVCPLTVLSALAGAAAYAALFPRLITGRLDSMIYELAADALVFGCIFLAGSPFGGPRTRYGRILYGILVGLCTMLLRQVAGVSLSIVYALLLCDLALPLCRGLLGLLAKREKKSRQKPVPVWRPKKR